MKLQSFLLLIRYGLDKGVTRPERISEARWNAMIRHCENHYDIR